MTDHHRRHELAAFLRARRERRSPEEAGLPTGGRRRTPGLRREEVASLSGVSITWYTWLEQGRDIHVSRQVLDALAGALGLEEAERHHLHVLADGCVPVEPGDHDARVSPELRALLAALDPNPAHVLSPHWDVLAWNRGAGALFGDFSTYPEAQRNILWLVFAEPSWRSLIVDWEREAARLVSVFRAAAGPRVTDPRAAQLVSELNKASDEFRSLWARHDVTPFVPAIREFNHPTVGVLALQYVKLETSDKPSHSLVTHLPLAGNDDAQRLVQLTTLQADREHEEE